jgi:hypothetical protein
VIRLLKWSLILGILSGAAGVTAWLLSPVFQERVLVLTLATGFSPLQEIGAKQLREYPSKTSAAALIAFVNYYAPTKSKLERLEGQIREIRYLLKDEELEVLKRGELEAKLPLVEAELAAAQKEFEASLPRKRKLSNKGMESLCLLTGHAFGTYFEKTKSGYSWGGLAPKDWPEVLTELNTWALRTFGVEALHAAGAVLVGESFLNSEDLKDNSENAND